MKYILHSISNGHILCDIFDDNDNLIIGNYMHNVPANFDESQIQSIFTDSIYPAIELMINPIVSDKVQIEASPVLVAMESAKETIDPDSVLDYAQDWSAWLDTDTITASTWTAPTGVTVDSDSFTDTISTVWLSGGTVGESYIITNHITTTAGRQDDRSIKIKVKEL